MDSNNIRILFIEDSEDDVFMMVREIRKSGYDPIYKRVQTADDVLEKIKTEHWDIIISDYSLPGFNGLAALELVKMQKLEIPFFLVSGAIGEEIAVKAMKSGAADYIMKDSLSRLVPAMEREVKEFQAKKSRKFVEASLRESEEKYRGLIESGPCVFIILNKEAMIKFISQNAFEHFDIIPSNLNGSEIAEILAEDVDRQIVSSLLTESLDFENKTFERVIFLKNSKDEKISTLISMKNMINHATIKGILTTIRRLPSISRQN